MASCRCCWTCITVRSTCSPYRKPSSPPKVKSGVIRLERREDIPQDFKAEALLRVVKAAFNQRRKTLRNALRPLGIPSGLADHPLLDRRAEQLSSAEFLDLSRWEWGN